ncbi:uncharacterized protein BDR25DRAFT_317959 [Lindgomyces ingoldianus]|uniref:Uncharacterized protein n=1 Tax=Lindgomyces ingoldianus TaxID=673940 RepID=A0ACB6QH04_9PLEO|nr:uncharacterized protein BDR25DRAFT_317959 [Lindgomyces ingoldianus]KAF2466166.1 hypothetical protein BDR25DRAFT_317959 [Lindgomyces ingoldianus]
MVEFLDARQCTHCGGPRGSSEPPFHCLRICAEKDCRTRDCSKHPSCWGKHIPNYEGAEEQHQMIDPLPQLFVEAVTYSEPDPFKQQALHNRDRNARWFTIESVRSGGGYAQLKVTDRFTELCDPGISGNRWSANQYPSFVSLIGDTCVGKSTLLRAMLLMGIVDPSGFGGESKGPSQIDEQRSTMSRLKEVITEGSYGPVTRTADYRRLTDPTSLGVHLYKDKYGSTSLSIQKDNVQRSFPILFADCEGFRAGTATTNSERSRARSSSRRRGPRRDRSPFAHEQDTPGFDSDNIISDEPIVASSYGNGGKDGVDLFYARFLYTISDAVVFVTKNDTTLQPDIERLLEWSSSAVFKSLNLSARRTLVIVRNMTGLHDSHLYNNEILKTSMLGNLKPFWEGSPSLAKFRQEYNKSQPHYDRKIHDNRDFLRLFFQDVNVCYIPDKARAENEQVFGQYRQLRHLITQACHESQIRKARSLMQHNVPTLTHILNRAFEHFRTSNSPFDFYDAARRDNPNPSSMADHITNFLRHFHETQNIPLNEDSVVSHVVSISLVSWALRTFKLHEPQDMYSRELRDWCQRAFHGYVERFQKCEFHFRDGAQCVARFLGHGDQHCDAAGNRSPGPFKSSRDKGGKLLDDIQWEFNWLYRSLCTPQTQPRQLFGSDILNSDDSAPTFPTPEQARELRTEVLQQFTDIWKTLKSNKTCFTCLQNVPDHPMVCGHVYCTPCIQEFGRKCEYYEGAYVMDRCILCQMHWPEALQRIKLKPKCAGLRVLALDGGGIRGVLELGILEHLESFVGINVPIRNLFDLIVGTSTGGIIALGLTVKDDLTIGQMKETFIRLAHKTFGKRREGELISKIDPFKITSKLMMLFQIFPSIYPTTPLQKGLIELFGRDTTLFSSTSQIRQQRATRVAVTSTKDASASLCLIANYNRFNLQNSDDFEREDENEKELRTWEAGLATSAAPLYFRPFKKNASNKDYVDGALHANFPVPVALEEASKIWPQSNSLDVLVSVGTGIQEREYHIPSMAKIGGIEKIFALFQNSLDTERSYQTLMNASQKSPAYQRIRRLNAKIDGGYVALDDHTKLEELDQMLNKQVLKPDGTLNELGRSIAEVADILIASLFFFEIDDGTSPTSLVRDPVKPKKSMLFGSIRCRLAHESPELKHLVNKIDEFTLMESVNKSHNGLNPSSSTSTTSKKIGLTDEQRNEVRTLGKRFRIAVTISTFDVENAQQVLAVRLKNRNTSIPISGFPVTLKELHSRGMGL